jgi:sulfatase maturation enzyme AslB (radical SAM superfamily)
MTGTINKHYTNPPVVAVELFSSGWCNLACKYCYIPKTDFLKGIHKNIIDRIKDGSMVEELKEIYGADLEVIAHWGTEPTLTIMHFKDFYEKAAEAFPKLKGIKTSSNFMTNPSNLVKFVTEIIPQHKELDVNIQVSLDGPPFITDKNRLGGSTWKIVENCVNFTKELNDVGTIHKVTMHFKPTAGDDDILLLADMGRATKYYEFFDEVTYKWSQANHNKLVGISTACDPTLVLPGTYTSEDGKNFYKLYLNQMELRKRKWKAIAPPDSNYYGRFKEKSSFYKELFIKHRMFTCSAGDSCFALGDIPGTSHICHQSFYVDHKEYYDEVRKYGLDEQTMEGIESGRIDNLKDHFITTSDDEKQTTRLQYLTRSYNDFVEFKHSTTIAQILELADCGQINPVYKDLELAKQFSYFAQVLDCPMDNQMISGSLLAGATPLLRVFGNGVFEDILRRVLKEKK